MQYKRILIAAFLPTLFLPSLAYSNPLNALCRSSPNASAGNNQAEIRLTSLKPFNAVPVNGVLGTANMTGSLICGGSNGSSMWGKTFVIQGFPNSGESGYVCKTQLDGVGIRYRNADGGGYTPCSRWGEFFKITNVVNGQIYTMNTPLVAELIKTKENTTLPPGTHDVLIDPKNSLTSFWPGTTNSSAWGKIVFVANTKLLVNPCHFSSAQTNVRFGTVQVDDVARGAVERPFRLEFSGCGIQSNAEYFNNVASLRFLSANIRADGNLDTIPCEKGCAKGTVIEVKPEGGVAINLNEKFRLKNGNYSIGNDTITHQFVAKLKPATASSVITPGRTDAILTLIIDSL
ncbi:hypothetical protein JFV28_13525 [Pseudomonas sp. TH05]|uniref:hypothetical protein n=1 Tax=unclassified Pseudomonas TaxID=196821 RepID=UPI0012903FD3|nr:MULTISPECIES: hypothetical protein [unclassified Pseudomonas]MBK5538138.1 hypothetical protein [Pseudomonas sp. TH07]MBK5556881.1 hypothetical protein [Pseudomonas sp. TH05]